MATCEYEVLRQQKIAENGKRMEQLGLQQVSESCTCSMDAHKTWSESGQA